MQKFEYTVEQIETVAGPLKIVDASATLNRLGVDGWELVAVIPVEEFHGKESLFYFKRSVE